MSKLSLVFRYIKMSAFLLVHGAVYIKNVSMNFEYKSLYVLLILPVDDDEM